MEKKLEAEWQKLFSDYQKKYPVLAKEFLRRTQKKLPENWSKECTQLLQEMYSKKESMATRKASQLCLTHFAHILPELMGGSADLTPSNLTDWKGVKIFSKTHPEGQYIHYGVREFAMTAMVTGLALHSGIIPYAGTFLTFSDYARNAIRLAAMMKQKMILVYTHDSIGLGEDGPTHQPVEHLPGLRLIPQLSVWRPCDTVETSIAWQKAIEHAGPTCLLFSRQSLPYIERKENQLNEIARGGYILFDGQAMPDVILIATGSEVSLALDAAKKLSHEGKNVRVVSMPSTDVFLSQDIAYQEKVLPKSIVARVAIEAAASNYWYKFVGSKGKVIGLDRFGASAPAKEVFKDCGFTVEHIIHEVNEMI